ncbi:MAG: DUF4920 domain-containing protein [Bacteroidetes bacterium]|nr:MAG: DUF4920 domain-containing protein [Bacteroidota bacterium]
MKKLLYVTFIGLAFACGNSNNQPAQSDSTTIQADTQATTGNFGDEITPDSAISIEEMKTQMGDKKEMTVKVTAPVGAVCQKKGCWMELTAADGSTMRVTFKDYGFFVPKDATGKTATILGVAKVEETSVADLQEYAKDDGKSKEEIAAINTPKKELVFEASGVILQ